MRALAAKRKLDYTHLLNTTVDDPLEVPTAAYWWRLDSKSALGVLTAFWCFFKSII